MNTIWVQEVCINLDEYWLDRSIHWVCTV